MLWWRSRRQIQSEAEAEPQRSAEAPGSARPDVLTTALKGLQLPTLRMLEGLLQGDHRQRKPGDGTELGELREYQPGDEIRRIEWNVTARTGVPHVRLQQEEREVTVWILLDRSPSMRFGTAHCTKGELALQAALALAYVALHRGDNVGAMVHHGGPPLKQGWGWNRGTQEPGSGPTLVSPAGKRRHLLTVLDALTREQPLGPMNWAAFLDWAAHSIPRRSLLFLLSDFLAEEGWEEPLKLLARRHEVTVLWLVDPRELELPDVGVVELVDGETGERCWLDSGDAGVRERYRMEAERRHTELDETMRRLGVHVAFLRTDQELLPTLMRFVGMKRRGGWSSLRP